jgi:hypothetical protein
MRLIDLAHLIADGDAEMKILDALAQRVARWTDPAWDWEHEAAVCECGLLLSPLARSFRMERSVVTLGRVMPVQYTVTHAHVADAAGRLRCPECAGEDEPCPGHDAQMCDTPVPVECGACAQAALPGCDYCLDCRPYEPEWDKDAYLGL